VDLGHCPSRKSEKIDGKGKSKGGPKGSETYGRKKRESDDYQPGAIFQERCKGDCRTYGESPGEGTDEE